LGLPSPQHIPGQKPGRKLHRSLYKKEQCEIVETRLKELKYIKNHRSKNQARSKLSNIVFILKSSKEIQLANAKYTFGVAR
jgi:hypothetical protein